MNEKGYANVNLKNGPIKERNCTDAFCAIIFLIFLITSFAVYAYGFNNGAPNQLLIPYDSDA